ncbi:unnamed protein product [Sphagnum balticum]
MSSSIETTPPRFDRRAHCVGEQVDPRLEAAASVDRKALSYDYNVVPEANKIRLEALEALMGDKPAALAVQKDLHDLAQHPGMLTPVLAYLAQGEGTRTLPVAKVEFEGDSNQVAAVTFDAPCLVSDAKYGSMKFQMR